jgi:hypothetical protein
MGDQRFIVRRARSEIHLSPLRGIYSRRSANLRHLRRPRLVERTMCSGNHPGPMKALTTITLRGSNNTAQDGFDPIASRSAADGCPRQSIPFGTG